MNLLKHFIILFLTIFNLNLFSQRNIHVRWDYELKKFVDKKGNVDYYNWSKNSKGLLAYINVLEQNHPKEHWSKNEKLSYWINAYNALTVNLIIKNFPISSIKDIDNPWGQKILHTKSKSYSLDEIEHKILRKMNEPRIHFAINCASVSCPNLSNSAYFATSLSDQLDKATRDFLIHKNLISKNEIKISKIFLWFKKDFGSKKKLIAFIEKYSSVKLINPRIGYLNYDWNLNKLR